MYKVLTDMGVKLAISNFLCPYPTSHKLSITHPVLFCFPTTIFYDALIFNLITQIFQAILTSSEKGEGSSFKIHSRFLCVFYSIKLS